MSLLKAGLCFGAVTIMLAAFSAVAVPSDAELATAFVGAWRSASRNEGPNAGRIATTYFADGTFRLVLYADDECKKVRFEAFGGWRIKDRELVSKTERVAGSEERLRPGSVINDWLVAVDGNTMILISSAGQVLRRVRGQPCLGSDSNR